MQPLYAAELLTTWLHQDSQASCMAAELQWECSRESGTSCMALKTQPQKSLMVTSAAFHLLQGSHKSIGIVEEEPRPPLLLEECQVHIVKESKGWEIFEAIFGEQNLPIKEGHYWWSRTELSCDYTQTPVLLLCYADESTESFAWMKDLMLLKRKVET